MKKLARGAREDSRALGARGAAHLPARARSEGEAGMASQPALYAYRRNVGVALR